MEIYSAGALALFIPGAIFLYLFFTSAWLRGPRWFAATLGALAIWVVGFILLAVTSPNALGEEARLGTTIATSTLLLIYAVFLYLIGGRYITRTGVWDLTFQSRNALNEYLDRNRIASPLATMLRAMPLLLAAGLVLLVVLSYWAESKGLLT